ncbi:MAG: AsmA family protein [Pseudomonadales bacterium]
MLKKIALGVVALLAVLTLIVVVFIWRFDPDSYRSELEVLLKQQTGLEFVISGGLKLQGGKSLQLSASDVTIGHAGKTLASFEQLSVGFDWRPLLDRQLIIDEILLQAAQVNLEMGERGELILPDLPERPVAEKTVQDSDSKLPLDIVRIEKIRIVKANLVLQQDSVSAEPLVIVENLDFELTSLPLVRASELIISAWPEYLSAVELQTQLTVERLKYEKYQISDVKALTHNQGQMLVTDLSLKMLGAALKSAFQFDWQPTRQALSSKVTIRGLQLPQLAKLFELKQDLQGELDLDWRGGSQADDWLAGLNGELAIRGDQLAISGFDLNRLMSNLQLSQELDLVDVGGLALMGPIGLLLTKGGDYGSIITAALKGNTSVQQLNMEWDISNKNARFKDVAVATDTNRLVLTGDFGLAGYTFNPVNLYLIDADGCDVFKQQIKGSVEKPEVSAMAFAAKSLLNPLVSLTEKGIDTIVECVPVYNGKVAAPPKPK